VADAGPGVAAPKMWLLLAVMKILLTELWLLPTVMWLFLAMVWLQLAAAIRSSDD
jgi:hypothetical protein